MSLRRRLRNTFSKKDLALSGYIDGLIMSNDTDADHDISFSVGEAGMVNSVTSTTTVLGSNASAFVKQIDNDWAAGTAAGGFPSGLTLSADTWYHCFGISQDDGTLDFGFDTATTASNLRSDATGYNHYRRVGSVLTDSSSNIIAFIQFGDYFQWDDPPLDYNAAPGLTQSLETLSVPPDFNVLAHVTIGSSPGSTQVFYIRSPDVSDETPASEGTFMPGTNTTSTGRALVAVDTSSQVAVRSDGNVDGIEIMTVGWMDPRGRKWV